MLKQNRTRPGGRSGISRGFTIVELIVSLAILGVLTAVAAPYFVAQAIERRAEATGSYFTAMRPGVEKYLSTNWLDLANATPLAGFANPLAPTLAELQAAGYVSPALGQFTPFDQPMAFTVSRVLCPGPNCSLDVIAYQVGPLLDDAGQPRYSAATTVRENVPGGLASDAFRTTQLAGPTGAFPNPLGAQGGVIGFSASLDTAGYNLFVRRNDDRLTALREALSVQAGPLATGGVALNVTGNQVTSGDTTVGGTLTANGALNANGALSANAGLTSRGDVNIVDGGGTNCVRLQPSGVVTIACSGTLNAKTGVFTDGVGNTTQIDPNGITATGRVVAAKGLATAFATMFDALNPDRITVSTTQAFIFGSGGRLVSFDGGDVVAEKNVSGLRVAVRDVGLPGAACAPTSGALGAGSEFASTPSGGMVVCRGGSWVPLAEVGTQGALCVAEGAQAVESVSNVGLICRGGRWTQTLSLLSSFVLVSTVNLNADGSIVPKPTCAANGGAFVGQPYIFLQAGNEASTDGAFNRFAEDLGASWRVRMVDGALAPLTGVDVVALSYCLYVP